MLLKGINGEEFDFNIIDYENKEEGWLMIDVKIKSIEGSFSIQDPALTISEAFEIANWFQDILDNKDVEQELYFLEPNLEFRFISKHEDMTKFKIIFSVELKPDFCIDNEYSINFEISNSEIESFIFTLRQQLKLLEQK